MIVIIYVIIFIIFVLIWISFNNRKRCKNCEHFISIDENIGECRKISPGMKYILSDDFLCRKYEGIKK
jgi:uncharacterized membrane protein YqiK